MNSTPAYSETQKQNDSDDNYYWYQNHSFRYQSLVFLWPTVTGEIKPVTPISIQASNVFAGKMGSAIQSNEIAVVSPDGNPLEYNLIRNHKRINKQVKIKPSDSFIINMKLNTANKGECSVAVILFGDESRPINGIAVPGKPIDLKYEITDDTADTDLGIIDYTGPIDLKHPASLIQMDSIFSARWKLWYEFAHHPNNMAGISLVAIPVNPLLLASMKGGNSTCFNMDDVLRFPLYYLRYFKATGDKSVLGKAKIGLETILSYTRDDGTMPYLISPWDGHHRPGSDLFEIYHSMRAVAEGIPIFSDNKAFTRKLISAYEKYRSFVFTHLSNGLFKDRASANGALLEAVYNRWKSTNDERELNDIRKLADALCTDYARQQRSDFGEYIPWVLIGLNCAYKATGNVKYSTEAYEWLTSTVIPSLKLDRRYYYSVPNFKPSGIGEGLTANPLQIWYHTDALLQMYEIRHDERLLKLAAWVFGDYYDRKRYASIPPAFIVDTENPYTERWGSASAEDALRMMAKYLWQTKYPTLFEESRANADTSSPCPWTDDSQSSTNGIKSEIAFDDGKSNLSTVIGLYRNNNMSYHQVQDFTVLDTTRISNVKIALHTHVGSKITPAPGFQESKIGIRVNGNAWRWLRLNLYMDDANHWLEMPIPVSELHNGLNRIETTSTVGSQGNMTPESLDMLGSSTGEIYQRSLHTNDFLTYKRLTDRNWEIRLRYDEIPYMKTEIHSLKITPVHASVSVGDSLQLMVESSDAYGKITHPSTITWSTKYGWIDKYGLYHPTMNGIDEITAFIGRKTVKSVINVNASVPFGVEPPYSKERLKYSLPDGHISLTGTWDFVPDPMDIGIDKKWQSNSDQKWGKIQVPGSWQAQGFGLDYHGAGWYRRQISVPSNWNGKQIWMKFDGAATSAKVWVNGGFVGEHTGNWSPFEFDITKHISTSDINRIIVRVEELPNHFSAGFPLIVGMHYGGIWQPVTIYSTGKIHIDDVFIHPILNKELIEMEVTTSSASLDYSFIDYKITAPDGKTSCEGQSEIDPSGITKISIPINDPIAWSPELPALYHASITVLENNSLSDKRELSFGMRDVEIKDGKLLLNGKPIFIRGSLHWGFYPELISIVPNEKQIRKEFTDLKKAGFNLVKVCMFTFPKRFYEIADEMGMLIWQEYPLWLTFPKSDDPGPHDGIIREYREWFKYDRNHPSVILRDLTCEAVDMNQELTRTIYDMGKSMTGNAVIEDNSAYLNTPISDFYDGHFYWELDTQYQNVGGWAIPAIRSITPLKPFIGGEDFDMDTYRDMPAIKKQFVQNGKIPWWLNNSNFKLQEKMEKDIINKENPVLSNELIEKQRLHSISTRKALIEEYRRFPEIAGYVVTHIRDNPITRPGFYDDLGKPKWKPEVWRQFTGDRVMVLHSERRCFCFKSNDIAEFEIVLSNYSDALQDIPLRWKIVDGRKTIIQGNEIISQARGDVSSVIRCKLDCSLLGSKLPKKLQFIAKLGDNEKYSKNEWLLWIFPDGEKNTSKHEILKHGSESFIKSLSEYVDSKTPLSTACDPNVLIVTDTLDAPVIKALMGGERVLYVPGDETLPRRDAPFWREITTAFPKGNSAIGDFPHDGFIDHQFLDMTQRRPFDTSQFRDDITPILWGMNARFTEQMLIDYIYEARVGKGKLLACCLNIAGKDNIAGEYLLSQMITYASGDSFNPVNKDGKKLFDLINSLIQDK